jgi:outer membrane protein
MKMNKIFSIAAISALLTSAANADLTRVEGAVGAWQSDPSGTVKYGNEPAFDVVDNAGFTQTTNTYAWVYIKHPIPVLPNLRLEYADPHFSDTTKLDLSYGGKTFNAGASNALSLKQYDAVLYYNILDNLLWTTLDIGLDIKYIAGNYNITGNAGGTATTVDQDFSITAPLLYLRGRVQLPLNIGIEAIARGITYSSNRIVDAEIKLDYTMNFIPVVQPGLEIGYRYQQVKLDGDSIGIDANLDTKFEGLYAGVMLRF